MRCGGSPRVVLAVDEGDAGVAEIESTELVDGFNVGRGRDVEFFAAGDCAVFHVDEAGYHGELVFWCAGAGLPVSPLRASLVSPLTRHRVRVELGFVHGVADRVASIQSQILAASSLVALDVGSDVTNVVQEAVCQVLQLLLVTGCDKPLLDIRFKMAGAGVENVVGSTNSAL